MSLESERMQILEMIDSGKITAVQGITLLKALEGNTSGLEERSDEGEAIDVPQAPAENLPTGLAENLAAPSPVESQDVAETGAPGTFEQPGVDLEPAAARAADEAAGDTQAPQKGEVIQPASLESEIARWKRWWMIPLWVGVGITVLGGVLMFLAYQASGIGFWFACAWFPLLLGVAIIALSFSSSKTHWLHIRIQQRPGEWPQRIAISMPLPTRLIAWALRTFGPRIPNMDAASVQEMMRAFEHASSETPFYVDVDEDGERVQIYVG